MRLFAISLFLPLFIVPVALAKTHIPNSEVVAEIQDKLYHAHVDKHGKVEVSFGDGVARLSGAVDSLGVKLDAEHATQKVDDVVEVVNNIRVEPDGVTDSQIIQQARKQILTYYAYTIFDWITLDASNNHLIVAGQVTDPYKKVDIGSFLERIKGVVALENNIQVLPVSNFDDQLRVTIARAIYNDSYFVQYADRATPSIHIIVDNGNVTLKGVVATPMDKAKAAADAATAATFFAFKNDLQVESP